MKLSTNLLKPYAKWCVSMSIVLVSRYKFILLGILPHQENIICTKTIRSFQWAGQRKYYIRHCLGARRWTVINSSEGLGPYLLMGSIQWALWNYINVNFPYYQKMRWSCSVLLQHILSATKCSHHGSICKETARKNYQIFFPSEKHVALALSNYQFSILHKFSILPSIIVPFNNSRVLINDDA